MRVSELPCHFAVGPARSRGGRLQAVNRCQVWEDRLPEIGDVETILYRQRRCLDTVGALRREDVG